MKLIGFCHGAPFDPHTWSGSNRGLFSALQTRDWLHSAHDVEVRGAHRYVAGLREFSFDQRVWRQNFLKSAYLFAQRSRRAHAQLRTAHPRPDAILQIGAMFDAAPAARAIARYCYLDSNTILSARGGAQSFSHYASAEHQRRAFARERAIYEAATGVFVFSDFVRDSLIADFGISPTRVHTVYAGINLRVPSSTRDRERDLTILFVGRDFDRKGGPLLLRAFARVRARLPDARLIIAGCNPGVSGAGIETVGFVDKRTSAGEAQLADLYGRAAVFTMPSHFEPFGIPYAEAMHFGVPCVAVNHCAMPEIVTHGVTGLLVPPDDETALAQALVAVLQDPLRSRAMGEAARAKAQRLFDWGAVAQKMHAVAERDREAGSWRAAI